MRFQPIIVPGWRNSGPGHWQSLWALTLPHAVRVVQDDWDRPDPGPWIACVARAVDAAPCPALLIAHSLGCLAVARLPIALRARVAGALLVAPADVERADAPEALRGFGPVAGHPLPFQSVLVASDDDPCCELARARQFAAAWGSRLVVVPNAGHINTDSGFGAWPQGLKLLSALRRRAAWRVIPPMRRIPPVPGPAAS